MKSIFSNISISNILFELKSSFYKLSNFKCSNSLILVIPLKCKFNDFKLMNLISQRNFRPSSPIFLPLKFYSFISKSSILEENFSLNFFRVSYT